MDKHNIINHLNKNIFFKLKPSKIHGIGLFAIQDIPTGTIIINNLQKINGIYLTKEESKQLNPEILNLCEQYFSDNKQDEFFIPTDPNYISTFYLSKYFINHTQHGNCHNQDGNIITIKPIKKNQEITLNYKLHYHKLYSKLNKKTKKKKFIKD